MRNLLHIEDDPASWVLDENTDFVAVAQQLREPSDPFTLHVVAPLLGLLLLNPRRTGSVALVEPPPNVGWIPGHIQVITTVLYLPSATGPTPDSPGYILANSGDLEALAQEILTAMRAGTVLTVAVAGRSGSGDLVINGAVLPFAVLCRAG